MQVIWSRTAQTRSCRCHSCLHAATTLARQSTTAASKRRLTASDVFTACYSAMFATVALVDMKFKDDRRKQWEIAIAEAKSSRNVIETIDSSSTTEGRAEIVESGHSNPQNPFQYKALSILGANERELIKPPPKSVWDKHRLTLSPSKYQDTTLEAELKALGANIRGVLADRELRSTEEGSVQVEVKHERLGRAPRHGGKLRDRVPKRLIHLEHMQQMILKLVTRFLIFGKPHTSSILAVHRADYDFHNDSKIMSHLAKFLETGTIWCPAYSMSNILSGDKMVEEHKRCNESIRAILTRETSTSNINSVVTKICYHLLISSAPPNIDTYNIMLIHFTQLKQHHLAQAVVDSFFLDSRFRPNSATIVAMLDHYAATNWRDGFEWVIQRMRATNGNMRVRRRHLSELDDPIVQAWAQERKVIHRNDFLIAKLPRNTEIFNSLILGSLRVFGSRRAALYLRAALREGCHISKDLFIHVARACLSEKNKNVAITLISSIISRWHQSQGKWQLGQSTGSQEAILRLMELCEIPLSINGYYCLPGNLRKVNFQVFKAWVRSVNLEVLNGYLSRSASSISGLEILFANYSSKNFTLEQVLLWMLELIDRHRVTEPMREPGALVTAIELVMDGFSSSCKELEVQLFDIVYGGLSADSRENFVAICKRSPNLDMKSKLAILRSFDQRRQENKTRDSLFDPRSDRANLLSPKMEEWKWLPSIASAWT